MSPVLITFRCVLRAELLALEGMREMFMKLLSINAERCDVDVIMWAIQSNHAHLVVRQKIDGHDPKRRTGIAAFMRNVLSALARHGNARATSRGHFVEETYHSHVMRTVGEVLRFLAYVLGQHEHHRVGRPPKSEGDAIENSAQVIEKAMPDGIVELLPDHPAWIGLTLEERCKRFGQLLAKIAALACEEERRVDELDTPETGLTPRELKRLRRDAWREAQARIAADFGVTNGSDDARQLALVPLADLAGEAAVADARARVRSSVWVPNEPHERRPTRLGAALEIRVTYVRR